MHGERERERERERGKPFSRNGGMVITWSLLVCPSIHIIHHEIYLSVLKYVLIARVFPTTIKFLSSQDCQGRLFLMEHCSRAVVMSSQVMAGMWKRNGYSVVNQIINYQFHYSKEVMYDRDILMLQVGVVLLGGRGLMLHSRVISSLLH